MSALTSARVEYRENKRMFKKRMNGNNLPELNAAGVNEKKKKSREFRKQPQNNATSKAIDLNCLVCENVTRRQVK